MAKKTPARTTAPTPAVRALARPYTHAEIKRMMKEKGQVDGVVAVDLNDIIEMGIDGFDDLLSEKLTGTDYMLMEIGYEVVGFKKNTLYIEAGGYVEVDAMDEDKEED